MPKLSKRERKLLAFFLDPITGKRRYNDVCRRCIRACKQSWRAVVECVLDTYRGAPKRQNAESWRLTPEKREGNTGGCLSYEKSLTFEENANFPTLYVF